MDPVTTVRNLIEEPSVETGIRALPSFEDLHIAKPSITLPAWVVAVVLLVLLLGGTALYYGRWFKFSRKTPDLDYVAAIESDPNLKVTLPR